MILRGDKMESKYDLSKFFRDPERAKRRQENGYTVQIVDGKGENERVVKEYFVTPEEVQARSLQRKSRRVQRGG